MFEIAILLYFMINSFVAGVAFTDYKTKRGWLTIVASLFVGTFILIFILGFNAYVSVKRSDKYRSIKFWIELNILGTFSKFTEKDIKRIARTVSFQQNDSIMEKEWERVRNKYNYRY